MAMMSSCSCGGRGRGGGGWGGGNAGMRSGSRAATRRRQAERRRSESAKTRNAWGRSGCARAEATGNRRAKQEEEETPASWGTRAAAGAAAVSLAIAASSLSAGAEEALRNGASEQLMSDFNVEFVGRNVDHKIIVELVVLGQTIGFVGAVVGGISARARKRQVENLNERLISVNKQLRQQARSAMAGDYEREDAINVPVHVSAAAAGTAATVDADITKAYDWQRTEVIDLLRAGKKALKEEDAHEAVRSFKLSLERAHENVELMDNIKKVERKAYRGLGGAYLILHDYDNALDYMKKVLDLSKEIGDSTGIGDALGVIADIYTDKGDLEKAGQWYDKYLEAMTNEMADGDSLSQL